MDPPTLTDHLDDLESQIDDLTTALQPLTAQPLLTTASTVPLLDKAKLYILLSYAIESLLFQSLLTSGVDAKAHPIFAELARLKTYFQKLKDAEKGPEEPKARIDKDAVGRFVRAGLAGNDKYDRERAEKLAKEKARAAIKARQLGEAAKKSHIKFDDKEESARMAVKLPEKRVAEGADGEAEGEEDNDVDSENEEMYGVEEQEGNLDVSSPPTKKKARVEADSSSTPPSASASGKNRSKIKNGKPESEMEAEAKAAAKLARRKLRRAEKKERRENERSEWNEKAEKEPELVIPTRGSAPKSHSETFKALLEGPIKKKEEKKEKKSKRK